MRKKIMQVIGFSLLSVGIFTNSYAIKPYWTEVNRYLFLNTEFGRGQMQTAIASVIGGVETWFSKYYYVITDYCYDEDNNYWFTLPFYGYTQVTAEKLAIMIYFDTDLGLDRVPNNVYYYIVSQLNADRSYMQSYHEPYYPPNYNGIDPFSYWKWRANYMEGRYQERWSADSTTWTDANCTGTANYLTRSQEWARAYRSTRNEHIQNQEDEWIWKFPHVFLWPHEVDGLGEPVNYSFDADLKWNSYFTLVGTGTIGDGLRNIINSFDIIRFSQSVGGAHMWDFWLNNQNLFINTHAAVYLCTDVYLRPWFYQKAYPGKLKNYPYDIHTLGDPNWVYENHFRSYFKHAGDQKQNLADSYDEDWANVE